MSTEYICKGVKYTQHTYISVLQRFLLSQKNKQKQTKQNNRWLSTLSHWEMDVLGVDPTDSGVLTVLRTKKSEENRN